MSRPYSSEDARFNAENLGRGPWGPEAKRIRGRRRGRHGVTFDLPRRSSRDVWGTEEEDWEEDDR